MIIDGRALDFANTANKNSANGVGFFNRTVNPNAKNNSAIAQNFVTVFEQKIGGSSINYVKQNFDIISLDSGKSSKPIYARDDYTVDDILDKMLMESGVGSFSVAENAFSGIGGGNKLDELNCAQEKITADKKAALLDELRSNGLAKEINWASVEADLNVNVAPDSLEKYIDYSAALFASLESRINNDFTGDERARQLDALNTLFEKTVNKVMDYYVDGLNNVFSKYGADIPVNDLKASVSTIMHEKRDLYSQFIAAGNNYANLNNTDDDWLSRDVNYMTFALKNAVDINQGFETKAAFSEKDLVAFGVAAMTYGSNMPYYNSRFKDEETIGLALAMNYLTTAETLEKLGASEKTKGYVNNLLDNFNKHIIDRVDEGFKGYREILKDGNVRYPALNKDDIYAVINKMKTVYARTKDAAQAIQEVCRFAYNQHQGNKDKPGRSDAQRYSPKNLENSFWSEFYGNSNPYMSALVNKWNSFATSLESGDLSKIASTSCRDYYFRKPTAFDLYVK